MTAANPFQAPLCFEFFLASFAFLQLVDVFVGLKQLLFLQRKATQLDKGANDDDATKEAKKVVNAHVGSPDYQKTLSYQKDKVTLGLVKAHVKLFAVVAWFLSLGGPKLWNLAGTLSGHKCLHLQSLVFALLYFVGLFLFDLPFQLADDFVVEKRHGFNNKTVLVFLKDFFLSLFVYLGLTTFVLVTLEYLLLYTGENFLPAALAFSELVLLLSYVLYPLVLAPLYSKQEKLKDGDAKSNLEKVAQKAGVSLQNLKVQFASKKSKHSDEYAYPYWPFKSFVVQDTLFQRPKDHQLALFAHELGHWKKHHELLRLLFRAFKLVVLFGLAFVLLDDFQLLESFGHKSSDPFAVKAALVLWVFEVVQVVLDVFARALWRLCEFKADEFAVKLGYGEQLAQALVSLAGENGRLLFQSCAFALVKGDSPSVYRRVRSLFRAARQLKTS